MLPHLTSLPTLALFGIALVCATLLHIVRSRNGRETTRGQWFNDGTASATLVMLALIGYGTVDPTNEVCQEMVRENGFLILWAFAYCAFMIALNLRDSARKLP